MIDQRNKPIIFLRDGVWRYWTPSGGTIVVSWRDQTLSEFVHELQTRFHRFILWP